MTQAHESKPAFSIGNDYFTPDIKRMISDAIDTVDRHEFGSETQPSDPTVQIMTWDRLQSILSPEQMQIIRQCKGVDIRQYGFRGAAIQAIDPPEDGFVRIEPQSYKAQVTTKKDDVETIKVVEAKTPVQFVPKTPYDAFCELNRAMREAIGKQVIIVSGYRSPAYQMMVFLTFLHDEYDYDFKKTAAHAALPGYSQHGSYDSTALDIGSVDILPIPDDPVSFEQTIEFQWMQQHAKHFNFQLSYPRDNTSGVMYEPWHWQYI